MRTLTLVLLTMFLANTSMASVDFDGTNDRQNCQSTAALDDIELQGGGGLSVSAWFKADSLGGGSLGRIVSKGNIADAGRWYVHVSASNTITFNKDFAGGTNVNINVVSSTTFNFGRWYHVLVTWDGSATATNVHIYLNGEEVAYGTQTNGDVAAVSDAALAFNVGNITDGSRGFDGILTDVAVWNTVLTKNDAIRLYLSKVKKMPLQIKVDNLKAYWPFDDYKDNNVLSNSFLMRDMSQFRNSCTSTNNPLSKAEKILSYQ